MKVIHRDSASNFSRWLRATVVERLKGERQTWNTLVDVRVLVPKVLVVC